MLGIDQIVKYGTILFIAAAIAFGVYYVSGLKADLVQSQANVSTLKDSVEKQQQTIATIVADQAKISQINKSLQDTNRKQENDIVELRDKFTKSSSGKERDVGKLAIAKTDLVEKTINKASISAMRCLEIASGSPLTEDEKNGKNTECPGIININK